MKSKDFENRTPFSGVDDPSKLVFPVCIPCCIEKIRDRIPCCHRGIKTNDKYMLDIAANSYKVNFSIIA